MNVRKPDPEKLRAMRLILKAAYDAVLSEDHSSFHDTLRGLK